MTDWVHFRTRSHNLPDADRFEQPALGSTNLGQDGYLSSGDALRRNRSSEGDPALLKPGLHGREGWAVSVGLLALGAITAGDA